MDNVGIKSMKTFRDVKPKDSLWCIVQDQDSPSGLGIVEYPVDKVVYPVELPEHEVTFIDLNTREITKQTHSDISEDYIGLEFSGTYQIFPVSESNYDDIIFTTPEEARESRKKRFQETLRKYEDIVRELKEIEKSL